MNCCVLGAGAWGTAMALHLYRRGHAVTLAPRRMEHSLALASARENAAYLPGHALPQDLQLGCELRPLLMEADFVFIACPSQALRPLCETIAADMDAAWRLRMFVTLCKGMDLERFQTPVEIVRETLPDHPAAALSGPTFAGEVAVGKPAAVALAAPSDAAGAAAEVQAAISDRSLRAYLTDDVRGTELAGALKNIYAIAAGVCDGLGLGDNAKASLITRSLSEMVRLGRHFGGRTETFYGLSGVGDLVATCSGQGSRNRSFGERIARGETPRAVLDERNTVTEGVRAAECFREACRRESLEAPILEAVHRLAAGEADPVESLRELMDRELKRESP